MTTENLPPELPPLPDDTATDHASSLAAASSSLVTAEQDILAERAQEMYLAGILTPDIADRMNIRHDQITAWKKKHNWELKRLQQDKDLSLIAAQTNPGTLLKQTTGRALRAITLAVRDIDRDLRNNQKLQVKDVKALTEIFATLDKISRLEQGRATDIVDTRTLSYSEAVHIIRQDPFAKNIVREDDG